MEPIAESCLESIVSAEQILSLDKLQTIMKNYFIGLGEGDFTELERILEKRFYTNLKKKISYLNDKGYQLFMTSQKPKILEIDVHKVKNFFTVGVEQNRKRNRLAKSYNFREDIIQDKSFNFIIDKTASDKSTVKVYIQYYLNVFTDMSINLVDKNTGKVIYKDDYIAKFGNTQENSENVGIDLNLEDLLGKSVVHNVIIEAEALEGNYQSLKKISRNIADQGEINLSLKNFKNKCSNLDWKIVDFDNFMDGNPLVSEYYSTLY